MIMACPYCGHQAKGQTGDQCPRCRIFLQPVVDPEEISGEPRLEPTQTEKPQKREKQPTFLRSLGKWVAILVGIATIFVLVLSPVVTLIWGNYIHAQNPEEEDTSIPDQYKQALYAVAEQEISVRLKDPQFPTDYLDEAIKYERRGTRYSISFWLESKNHRGAILRQKFYFSAAIKGEEMEHIVCEIG